jgi:hypothetical protein
MSVREGAVADRCASEGCREPGVASVRPRALVVVKLVGPGQHLRLRQRAVPRDVVRQVFPLDELHHQVDVAAFLEEVADAHQVGMLEAGQDVRLPLELLVQLGQGSGVEPRLRRHLLERQRHVEPCIPGAVDGTHSSLSQQGDDAVAVLKQHSCTQRHRATLISNAFEICEMGRACHATARLCEDVMRVA